ncbi:helix-turn-helix domain-containing protein [Sungkyunkwania multivorans]|uniref:Helix-turn-helix domain-containing protein n=1 Tax=Sungkyunkwania multivorans TaxID=1173618 RepID=A0ABW3CY42_9FLAO
MTSFFNFLLIAGALQGFVFIIATFFSRKKVEKPIIFLNLIVLFLSLNNLQAWLIDKGHMESFYFTKHLMLPWYLPIFPLFHVFVLYYFQIEEKLKTYLKFSFVLFGVEIIIHSGIIWYMYHFQEDINDAHLIKAYDSFEEMVNSVYCVFIFVNTFLVLFKHEKLHKFILGYDDILWIKRFMSIGAIVVACWLIAIVINNATDFIKYPYSYYPMRLTSSILLYWISYQGFFRYMVVSDRILLRKSLGETDGPKLRVTSKKESDDIIQRTCKSDKQEQTFLAINMHVVSEQKYLDPNLNLESLAEELNMSAGQLSAHINSCSSYNFSDYINNFRVEQAKRFLGDEEFEQYTIVAIGLECGFNSKSAFYAAFKKFTGETPTDYRKAHT